MIETRTTIQPHKSPSFAHSRQLQRRAHARIPGGAHTYAKGDDQYPVNAPSFIVRGEGCHVWDVDGNEFIEYGMGLRSVMLGHAYGPVIEAAREQLSLGANFARPSPLEVKCADKLAELVPSAGMVKFAKDGSTVTSAAVRLARAFTGRDRVVVCKDDPFISTADWFIGTTPMSAGIPQAVRALTLSFPYNDLPSLELLFAEHPGEIACVIMEAERGVPPIPGFLGAVSALCHREGALFILDEMITGFRWALGGAQEVYGVAPDLSCFGKGMANGFSVSALVGRREIMELGGWQHAGPRVFLNSTTHGGETHSLAAAMKTMEIFQAEPVTAALRGAGERLTAGIDAEIERAGVGGHFGLSGRACNLVYITRDGQGEPSQAFRTLFLQETIKRGLLMPSLVVSYSHGEADIAYTIEAIGEALHVYRRALEDGIEHHLEGRPVQPVFRGVGDLAG